MRTFILSLSFALGACSVNPLDPDDIGNASLIPEGAGGSGGGGGQGGGGGGESATCGDLCEYVVQCCGGGDVSACTQTCANDPQFTPDVRDAYLNASCDQIAAETGCR